MQVAFLACLAMLVLAPAVRSQDANRIPCSADRLTMYMPDAQEYKYLEELGYCAPTKDQGYITFWIKSSNDAWMTLTSTFGTYDTQVHLGYESWGPFTGTTCHAAIVDVESTDGTCYLSDQEWRQFWVSWSNGVVEVGTGGVVGLNGFLSGDRDQEVNYIGVYSNWGAHAQLAFGYDPTEVKCGDAAGVRSMVYEEAEYTYRYLEDFGLCLGGESGSVIFWHTGRGNDAHITLSDSNDQDDEMTFNIGVSSNTELSIFNHGGKQVSVAGTWLAEGVWKPFWISWSPTDMVIGTGTTVGENQIGRTGKDASQEVNFIGVCSDWWNLGSWAFNYETDPSEEQEEQEVEFSLNTADVTEGMSAEGATCFNTITEIQACVDLCVDRVVNTGCFGIDWNHASNPWNNCRCWIHEHNPGPLSPNSNVDHYMPHV